MTPYEYASQHYEAFLNELIVLLKIPSVSTLPEHAGDVHHAAAWIVENMRAQGIEARLYETEGHPIVYGEWLDAGQHVPTVLVYGHYDVQPADPLELWKSPPFEPTISDGKLYARGASDDKGQLFVHIKAAEAFLKSEGKLPVNLKFILEGEEESGSPNLEPFIKAHSDLLSADVILISDTHAKSLEQPSIVYALRGMSYMELEVFGPRRDLHSGTFGGVVHNPAQALCEIIAKLHDENGTILVPGFYDDVRELDPEEREELNKAPYTEEQLKAETGIPSAWGEAEFRLHERTGARPTLEVNGLVSGWTGEGAKTVLPSKALAKISCRLVADQDPHKIYELVRDYVAAITPPTVTSEVRLLHTGKSAITDRHTPAMEAAIKAFEVGWGARPIFTREGGSIPVVSTFQEYLGAPVILMGFGLPDDGLHAPNEKFTLECFRRGITTSIAFMQALAD